MALITVRGQSLVLRLNPLERLMTLRLRSPRVPLAEIEQISVQRRVGGLLLDVDLGFAGNTAPAGVLLTASCRARYDGGRAACLVYARVHAVRVTFHAPSRWRLWLVSSVDAEPRVERLRRSIEAATEQAPDRTDR